MRPSPVPHRSYKVHKVLTWLIAMNPPQWLPTGRKKPKNIRALTGSRWSLIFQENLLGWSFFTFIYNRSTNMNFIIFHSGYRRFQRSNIMKSNPYLITLYRKHIQQLSLHFQGMLLKTQPYICFFFLVIHSEFQLFQSAHWEILKVSCKILESVQCWPSPLIGFVFAKQQR